jgi:hypothetical protein
MDVRGAEDSFLPRRLMKNSEKKPRATPKLWSIFRFSENMSSAPIRTRTGRVAEMGPEIVSGRCFMLKYPSVHDTSTIADFSRM